MNIFLSRSLAGLSAAGVLAFAPLALANNDNRNNKNDDDHIKVLVKGGAMVSVNPSGKVLVRGATVTAASGSTITATTVWGGATLSWTVNTNTSTEFVNREGRGDRSSITFADIKVGDVINFDGSFASGSSLTVTATTVRDQSLVKAPKPAPERSVFQGTLQSVASTSLPTTLVLLSGGTSYSVSIALGTPILKASYGATTLTSFQIGDTVRVYGSLTATGSTVINALVVRDATR